MDRRQFVQGAAAVAGASLVGMQRAEAKDIRVLVWDERQPAQKPHYANFLGNAIADHLKTLKGFDVLSVGLDDPEQGLSSSNLDAADVLIWWGHVRHPEVKVETAKMLVERIRDGKLNFLGLHSAHWSMPFIEAMNSRSVDDALAQIPKDKRATAKVNLIQTPRRGVVPKDAPMTPRSSHKIGPNGDYEVEVHSPSCVFNVVENKGTPGYITTTMPKHPVNKGLPEKWTIPQTEIYGGIFYVPKPDAVFLTERWDTGDTFDSGCDWKLGKGRVVYFRPGHETYPIFKQELPLKIVENACRYLGK